jgi:hypothetical protein
VANTEVVERCGSQWLLAMVVVACLLGCGGATSPAPESGGAAEPAARARVCHYDVQLVDAEHGVLEVQARCDGQVLAFDAAERLALPHISRVRSGSHELAAKKRRFTLPAGERGISYRVDLDGVARDAADIDVCYRAQGATWVAAVSTFILAPRSVAKDAIATIAVSTPRGGRFATGLRYLPTGPGRKGKSHWLRVAEIANATYGVFGAFTRDVVTLPGPMSGPTETKLEVIIVPGRLSVSRADAVGWVRDGGAAVAEFWGGFPVKRAMVVLLPTPGHRKVAHGKVVAAGGAGVALHLGAAATKELLYDDWILVHELFHLGFPSFWGEGKWLDEGLATYYEPIIRARAGWRSPRATWHEFSDDMGRGLDAVQRTGLERVSSFQGIYWGGAIVALLADVQTRSRTKGALGLEDGLRAVLARGGDASQVWSLDKVIKVVDGKLGAPTLRRLADAHSFAGAPVNLRGLLRDLGVQQVGGEVRLDDSAKLALIRRAIITPPRN